MDARPDGQVPATPLPRPDRSSTPRPASLRVGPRRVPEVTPSFWIIKVLTTALGESTSDYLVHRFDPVIAVACAGVALAALLVLQFAARRYVPWIYWLAVAMVAVFGTMAADVLHIRFGVAYVVSTVLFAGLLVVVFVAWY